MLPFSINTDTYDTDIEPRLSLFAEVGFRFVHWAEHTCSAHLYSDKEIERTGRLLKQYQLQCLDIHGCFDVEQGVGLSLAKWVELNTNRMEFLHALGGDLIVLHVPLDLHVDGAPDLDMAKRMIDALLPLSGKLGMRLAIENCRGQPGIIEKMLGAYTSEDLGFCYDSGHALLDNRRDILEAFLDRVLLVHLHDNYGTNDDHYLPGRGIIDWEGEMQLVLSAPCLKVLTLEVGLVTEEDRSDWIKAAHDRMEQIAGYAG